MNRLLTGASVALALAIAGPAFAQSPTSPSPAGSLTVPSSSGAPYSSGLPNRSAAPPSAQQAPSARQAAQNPLHQTAPYAQQPPPQAPIGLAGATMGAPPDHAMEGASQRPKRHASSQASQKKGSRPKGAQANDNVADQLNREELSRASGSAPAPSAIPQPGASMR